MFNVIARNPITKEVFKNLKVNDVVTFKDLDTLIEEDEKDLIEYGWNTDGMDYLIDEYSRIIIDEERYNSLKKRGYFDMDGWGISLDMLKYDNSKLVKL